MTPLEQLQMKHTEAELVRDQLEAVHRKQLLDEGKVPMALVRKLSAARAEVRRLAAEIRAGRVDNTETIVQPRFF